LTAAVIQYSRLAINKKKMQAVSAIAEQLIEILPYMSAKSPLTDTSYVTIP